MLEVMENPQFLRTPSHSRACGTAVSFTKASIGKVTPMILSTRKVQCHRPVRPAAGFTLLELMITIGIAAILLTIGIPSFRYVTTANRASAEINAPAGRHAIRARRSDSRRSARKHLRQFRWRHVLGHHGLEFRLDRILWLISARACARFHPENSGNFYARQLDRRPRHHPGDLQPRGLYRDPGCAVTFTLHDPTANAQYTRCLSATIVGALSTQIGGNTTAENNPC